MEWIKFFVVCPLIIMIESDSSPLSPRLVEVINSLNGSAGDDIRFMFYAALMEQMYPYFGKRKNDLHPLECYQRLLGIMNSELRCPMAAREYQVFLDIMEYNFNKYEHVGVWPFLRLFSMFERDCSELSGKHAEICALHGSRSMSNATLSRSHLDIPSLMDKCFSEGRLRQDKMLSFR